LKKGASVIDDQDIEELPAVLALTASADPESQPGAQPGSHLDPTLVLQRLATGDLSHESLAAAVALAREIVNRNGDSDA
jgi:hypothetical protein